MLSADDRFCWRRTARNGRSFGYDDGATGFSVRWNQMALAID